MAVGESDAKHGAGEHLGNDAGKLYGFFFSQAISISAIDYSTGLCGFFGLKSRWFCGFIQWNDKASPVIEASR
jgi:hypothetical protein